MSIDEKKKYHQGAYANLGIIHLNQEINTFRTMSNIIPFPIPRVAKAAREKLRFVSAYSKV